MFSEVTVILPTYNRRAFLPHALDCFTAQTFRAWRLLVVNDGGEDVSDLVTARGDPRIEYFDRPHAGKPAQLNFALGLVESEFVSYMDDDDEVFPEHLEKLVSAARAQNADFVYSDTYQTILSPSGDVLRRIVENDRDAPWDEIRVFNRVNHKQILHTKALADRVGPYDETLRILIDFDYIKRLAREADRPFHLREVTGDHFLRVDAATGEASSISGLWKRDPDAAGRSLLAFFAKDPGALAALYRTSAEKDEEIARLRAKLARRLSARLRGWRKRLFG